MSQPTPPAQGYREIRARDILKKETAHYVEAPLPKVFWSTVAGLACLIVGLTLRIEAWDFSDRQVNGHNLEHYQFYAELGYGLIVFGVLVLLISLHHWLATPTKG